jgi:hypothetical protein
MAMFNCLRSGFGLWPTKNKKYESSICTIKNLSDNENMASFLWQGNLLNRTSKIKRLLARHDIHLPRAKIPSFEST